MKPWRRLPVFPAVLAVIQALELSAQTDTDALSFPSSKNPWTVGYLNAAGVGWAFRPMTNLSVTWVGYGGAAQAAWSTSSTITFWTSTNTPLATYPPPGAVPDQVELDTNRTVFGTISPLILAAGREYYVTMDGGSNTTLIIDAYVSDASDPQIKTFRPAPELTYLGVYVYSTSAGPLRPDSAPPGNRGYVLLGPTFRFQVVTQAPPLLEITFARGTPVLAWSTNSPGCTVETAPSLAASAWEQVSNAPAILGDRFVLTNSLAGPTRFFRLRLR